MTRATFVFACILAFQASSPVSAEEKSFDSNGVKIHYLDQSKGAAVVLLHGFTGSASAMWEKRTQIFPTFAKEYRVLAPDFRGHGKSDKPHDAKKCGAELAEDVIRLLDHLKIEKAHVVGYSMGSTVAGKLLVSHPDRLLSVTFGGGGPQFRPSKAFFEMMDAAAESLEQDKGMGPLMIAMTPAGAPKLTPELAANISKLALGNNDQKALAAVLRGHEELTVTEAQLKANKVPVLFVHGSQESDIVKERVTESRMVLADATLKVIENSDHRSTVASPEFQTVVLEFVRKNNKSVSPR